MRAEKTEVSRARVCAITIALLVLAAALALGLSLFLAFPARGLALSPRLSDALQIANVVLSSFALIAAVLIARRSRDATGGDSDAMVTVCAWTRRVLWDGSWVSFEEYLAKRFNQRCTHGICDEAAAKMREDAEKMIMPPELRGG